MSYTIRLSDKSLAKDGWYQYELLFRLLFKLNSLLFGDNDSIKLFYPFIYLTFLKL